METGTIPIDELAGGLDLYRTLESGQSYLWRREDGEMYTDTVAPARGTRRSSARTPHPAARMPPTGPPVT